MQVKNFDPKAISKSDINQTVEIKESNHGSDFQANLSEVPLDAEEFEAQGIRSQRGTGDDMNTSLTVSKKTKDQA